MGASQRSFLFYYDARDDLVIVGAISRSMDVYRGNLGYREFAGRRIAYVMPFISDDGRIIIGNGGYYTFDADGLVDQQAQRQALGDIILCGGVFDNHKPDPITARRMESARFRLTWSSHPTVFNRVVRYMTTGERLPGTTTTRRLTKVERDDAEVDQ